MDAALQWSLMTSLVLYFLTFVDEFLYVTVKPQVVVVDSKTHQ